MVWHTTKSGRRYSRGMSTMPEPPPTPVDPRVHLPKHQRPHVDTMLADGTVLTSWTDPPLSVVAPPPPPPKPKPKRHTPPRSSQPEVSAKGP